MSEIKLKQGLLGDTTNPEHPFNVIKVKQGAFALQGFNLKRILQRPYFGLDTDKTDFEIMDNFEVPPNLSIEELETRLNKYKDIHTKLLKYGVRLSKHTEKLFKMTYGTTDIKEILSVSSAKQISERANTLLLTYSSIANYLKDFIIQVVNFIKKVTETIQQQHRNIFARQLKNFRKSEGFTQKQLGDKIGKTQNAINLYESGQREPPLTVLIGLSKALNKSTDKLLGISP